MFDRPARHRARVAEGSFDRMRRRRRHHVVVGHGRRRRSELADVFIVVVVIVTDEVTRLSGSLSLASQLLHIQVDLGILTKIETDP